MASNKNKDGANSERQLAYTTDPAGFNPFKDLGGLTGKKEDTNYQNPIRIKLEKKGRGGKMVSIVTGLEDATLDLKELAKELKGACGTGGSAKEGVIIIQGDHRDKIAALIKNKGYTDVKKSGA